MTLDCYEFCLWTLGEVRLTPSLAYKLIISNEGDELNEY